MKTSLLLIGVLLRSLTVFGQSYKSIFSSDTTRWNVYECARDAGGTFAYYSFSDTLINEKVYHIMFHEYIYSGNQKLKFDNNLSGYVHEDTTTGKYWFLKFVDNEPKEALFMNMSLDKGDTMTVISDFRYMRSDSVIVDSVYYVGDKKIVIIDMEQDDCHIRDKIKFIEGVGPSNGFYMGQPYEYPESYTLMCKFDNDLKTYSTDKNWFKECYYGPQAGIYDFEFENTISVYPNPAKRKISIMTDNPDLEYAIFNSLGQRLTEGKLSEKSQDLEINQNGIFFIKISNNNYQTTKKVIIYGY